MNENKYFPIIGLEVHVELKTKSKMFCGCPANYFGKKPNTQTCPVCLGLPGALPVPNKKAIEWCIMIGLALNCKIPLHSKFDRKHYFYPDLPKGYQISQYDSPFCVNGSFVIARSVATKQSQRDCHAPLNGARNDITVRIRRVHMEEDTGKLIHATVNGEKATLIDFNRSGVPLVEIVTEPDIHSSHEAKEYLIKLQQIIRNLGVSDCDMEKGSMRLEPNISLQDQRSKIKDQNRKLKLPDYKVEVKNINSFKFVEKAINYEIKRQKDLLEKGKKIHQETRGWDEKRGVTYSQRSKEEAKDYRYFPEPDIPPFVWTKNEIKAMRKQMPKSIDDVLAEFKNDFKLPEKYVVLATATPQMRVYFTKVLLLGKKEGITAKELADYFFNRHIDMIKVPPGDLISQLLSKKQIKKLSTDELLKVIKKIVSENPKIAADFKKGKQGAINVLVGKTMKETRGKADPKEAIKLIMLELNRS